MKIVQPALETRYHELTVKVTCESCGDILEAKGEDAQQYIYGTPISYSYEHGLGVHCPRCHKIAKVKLSDTALKKYILSL